ncbi:MAG: glycoside hydrolase family 105 protein [Anaerolineae bacterium]
MMLRRFALVVLAAGLCLGGGPGAGSPAAEGQSLEAAIAVPYASVGVGLEGRDPTLRRVAERTMAMTGRINEWDWEGGIAMVGLMHAYEVTGDQALLQFVTDWVDARIAEGEPFEDPRWSDPDCSMPEWHGPWVRHPNHAAPAWATLMLYLYVPRPEYRVAVDEAVDFLSHRACRAGGTLAHLPGQLWDDTLAMSVPLLVRYGVEADRPDLVDQAASEYLAHERHLEDRRSGLWFHGWSFETQDHMSGAYWGRGNGWVAVAGAELLRWLPADHPDRPAVQESVTRQLDGLVDVQDGSGMWHTVVDRPDFYLETSATAAISAALARGIADGWLPATPARRTAAARGRVAAYGKVAPDGTVTDVSQGTGVASTIEVYNQVPKSDIKPYGQGLFLMMASVAHRQ